MQCFPSITEFLLEDFYVPDGQLKKGLLPGVRLDVYYPGFPTLKHIPHTVSTCIVRETRIKMFQGHFLKKKWRPYLHYNFSKKII